MTAIAPHVLTRQSHERAFVPSLVAIGLVVSIISSLGAPLIPTLAEHLHASVDATQWSLTSTLLVGAVASPVVGRLGDGPHRRTVLLVCLSIVTLGGAVAAVAGSLGVLVAGRALQGLGLALLPLTMASAREHLPQARAREVIALLSIVSAIGVGLGYPITGFIAEHFDPSAAFWFGATGSAFALLLAALFVPPPGAAANRARLDVAGAALIGTGVLALLLALEKAPRWGWVAPRTVGLLGVAAILLALWTRVELRLVRRRSVLTANVTALVLGVAMYLCISLMTQLVQLPSGLHASVFVAGLTLLPLSALSTLSSRLLPTVRRLTGPRATIPIGAGLIAAAMLFIAQTGGVLWAALLTMGIIGLGLGFTFAAMPALIIGSVPQNETSSAMSFYQVTRYVGFSVGAGLAITLLRAFGGSGGLPTAGAYTSTFRVGAALCLVAAVVAWILPGPTPRAPAPEVDERSVEEGELAAAGLPGEES